jgi:hypothetical protein
MRAYRDCHVAPFHLADIEYVDLRFGNRVFYKLKGQEAVGE